MLEDIRTVMWKELREILRQDGELKNGLSILLMPLALGVLTAGASGARWLHPLMALIFAILFPPFCILGVVADSFAGERERETLEALLATRLSDSSILRGKIFSLVVWSWTVTLFYYLTGLVTVNIVAKGSGLLFFGVPALFAALVIPPLSALATASLGMHFTLRSGSVKQANMLIGYTFMGLCWVLGIVLSLVLKKSMRKSIAGFVTGLDSLALVLLTALFLLAVSVVAMKAAQARFRRARLILD